MVHRVSGMRLIGDAGTSAVIVGIAFFVLWSGAGQWHLGLDSEHWPVTQGKVVNSKVVVTGHGPVAPRASASVSYTYVVADSSYTAHNISFGVAKTKLTVGSGWEDARMVASGYPVGATVTVHYRPRTPHLAVLEPGVTPGSVLRTLAGVFAGIVVFLFQRLAYGRPAFPRNPSRSVATSVGSQMHGSPTGAMVGFARLVYVFAMASIAWSGFESDPGADLPTFAAALIVLGMFSATYLNTAFRCPACGEPFARTAWLGGWRSPLVECPSCGAPL